MAAATRKAPPTHPTVWIGLGLAAVGLLVATFAYSGTRVYDIIYAVVALLGAVIALAGILLAAWGRSVMAARAQRSRRSTMSSDTMRLQEALEQPPTVAAPRSKRSFALASLPFRGKASAAPPQAPLVEAPLERLDLECPSCSKQFVAEGRRPFTATCPHCGHSEPV